MAITRSQTRAAALKGEKVSTEGLKTTSKKTSTPKNKASTPKKKTSTPKKKTTSPKKKITTPKKTTTPKKQYKIWEIGDPDPFTTYPFPVPECGYEYGDPLADGY